MSNMSNIVSNVIQEGNNPLEQGKKTISNIFNAKRKRLSSITFISDVTITYKAGEYNLPMQNKFLYQDWNKTFLVEKKKDRLTVKLLANFIVTGVKECTLVYNDKSGKKPNRYYVVTLQNDKGRIESDVEIAYNSKSDVNQFQTTVNNLYTGFSVCMKGQSLKPLLKNISRLKLLQQQQSIQTLV